MALQGRGQASNLFKGPTLLSVMLGLPVLGGLALGGISLTFTSVNTWIYNNAPGYAFAAIAGGGAAYDVVALVAALYLHCKVGLCCIPNRASSAGTTENAMRDKLSDLRWKALLPLVLLSVAAGAFTAYKHGQELNHDPDAYADDGLRFAANALFFNGSIAILSLCRMAVAFTKCCPAPKAPGVLARAFCCVGAAAPVDPSFTGEPLLETTQ